VVDQPITGPSFSVASIVDRLAPRPLAPLQVRQGGPVPLAEAQRLFDRASEPKRMWVIDAGGDQDIGDEGEVGRGLLEAMDWAACASSH
jgi:hypothetical protein